MLAERLTRRSGGFTPPHPRGIFPHRRWGGQSCSVAPGRVQRPSREGAGPPRRDATASAPALSAMPVVGPVTRGQDLYWRLLSGQQVLPIQCGSSAYAKRYLEYYNFRAVDAQEVGRNAFVSTGYSWNSTPLWRGRSSSWTNSA